MIKKRCTKIRCMTYEFLLFVYIYQCIKLKYKAQQASIRNDAGLLFQNWQLTVKTRILNREVLADGLFIYIGALVFIHQITLVNHKETVSDIHGKTEHLLGHNNSQVALVTNLFQ